MPWPPRQPRRNEIPLEDLSAYGEVLLRALARQDVDPEEDGGIYGRFLLAPRMAAGFSRVGSVMRTNSNRGDTYSHADREWIDQVIAVRLKTNVLQRMHLPDAIAAGVRPGALAALRTGRTDELTPEERVITEFVESVLDGTMRADVWNPVEERMGERGAVEYALSVLYVLMGTRLYQLAGMPDPTDEEVNEWLERYERGERPPADWQRRNA